MWNYEKRLEYPVKIKQTNPALAAMIISQYGGPDGELGASMRYISQRYSMPYREVSGLLTDIGTEELGPHLGYDSFTYLYVHSITDILNVQHHYILSRLCTSIALVTVLVNTDNCSVSINLDNIIFIIIKIKCSICIIINIKKHSYLITGFYIRYVSFRFFIAFTIRTSPADTIHPSLTQPVPSSIRYGLEAHGITLVILPHKSG